MPKHPNPSKSSQTRIHSPSHPHPLSSFVPLCPFGVCLQFCILSWYGTITWHDRHGPSCNFCLVFIWPSSRFNWKWFLYGYSTVAINIQCHIRPSHATEFGMHWEPHASSPKWLKFFQKKSNQKSSKINCIMLHPFIISPVQPNQMKCVFSSCLSLFIKCFWQHVATGTGSILANPCKSISRGRGDANLCKAHQISGSIRLAIQN